VLHRYTDWYFTSLPLQFIYCNRKGKVKEVAAEGSYRIHFDDTEREITTLLTHSELKQMWIQGLVEHRRIVQLKPIFDAKGKLKSYRSLRENDEFQQKPQVAKTPTNLPAHECYACRYLKGQQLAKVNWVC
jgi:hypothetical protein